MSILKLKKSTKYFLVILLTSTAISCISQGEKFKISEIHTAIKIDDAKGYEYSEESYIKIDGSNYSLRQKAVYDETGNLQTLTWYKPEGKIEYQKEDIERDKAIVEYLGFPLTQQWIVKDDKLEKENQSIDVQKVNDSLIKTVAGNKITFYKLRVLKE